MYIRPLFIAISSILALISPVIYARSILRGEAKPHRTTRIVLLLITALSTISLIAQHNTVAVWLAGVSTLQSMLVFGLSIKHGMGGWAKSDILCLVIALAGIVAWQTTNNPRLVFISPSLQTSQASSLLSSKPIAYHTPKTSGFLHLI